MLRDMDTLELATLLMRKAGVLEGEGGHEYPDGVTVMNMGVGYCGEFYNQETVWVTGNWNDNTRYDETLRQHVGRTGSKRDTTPSRLARALEFIGVECEWHDVNDECQECHKLLRTWADSYSWTLYGAWIDEVGYVCQDCMRKDLECYIEEWVNDSSKAITWLGKTELRELEFVQWEPEDPQTYEHGWHPGQTDDPSKILETIHDAQPDSEVVFRIAGVGQFDVRFEAWVRSGERDDD